MADKKTGKIYERYQLALSSYSACPPQATDGIRDLQRKFRHNDEGTEIWQSGIDKVENAQQKGSNVQQVQLKTEQFTSTAIILEIGREKD